MFHFCQTLFIFGKQIAFNRTMKSEDTINLNRRSQFSFKDGKISRIVDIR